MSGHCRDIIIKKLAILSTHPIQYNAPLFKLLNERGNINIRVFYTWGEKVLEEKHDPGFGKSIQWDIPLLEGYEYVFVENLAKDPGSHHFKGIKNPDLITQIEKWGADSVLVYGWNFKSHLKVMRHFKGKIPVFFRGDSNLIDRMDPLKKIIRKFFLKLVYRNVDSILYVGTNNLEYFQTMGLKSHQLIFAPHAVENQRFFPNENNIGLANNLRNELGISLHKKVFLFAGKLELKKNCAFLIDVFKNIETTNAHLIIVGNGDQKSKLELTATDRKNIHFLDFQNQQMMPVIYQLADIFVLPSRGPGETWGLSINEAMASAKAVLVSDACGAAIDLVQNGINGFVFHTDNKNDLTEKMNKLLENDTDLKKMGDSSLKLITEWNYERDCNAIEFLLL